MTSRVLSPLTAIFAAFVFVSSSPAAPDAPPGPNDISVLARGPVHEGYAQPFAATPQPGPIVPKAPPDPVPEEPPDQKPEGDNVQWIPGYWSWDGDKSEFIWVSGFWRAIPPQRKWVAGYWQKTEDGWQWVGGYWAPESQNRPELLDPPPESPEAGPSIPAPDERSMYVPGTWMRRSERYFWRPGYWSPARLGWVWVPAHYVWTPGGYVFVEGYWDYPLETRGVLFAPVVFERPLWRTPGWCYQPSYVVGIDPSFYSCLFIDPLCRNYCFGDYYDPGYFRAGYRPWSVYGSRLHDPLYGYYRWSHRDDPAWLRGINSTFAARRDGTLTRPGRTLSEQATVVRRAGPAAGPGLRVVQPLSDFRGGSRLAAIDRTQVARHQAAAQRIVEASRQRGQLERPSARGRPIAASSGAARVASSAAPKIVNNQPPQHAAAHHAEAHAHTPAPATEHRQAVPEHSHPTPHAPSSPPAHHSAPAHAPERHVSPPAHLGGSSNSPAHAPSHPAPRPKVSAPPARHASPAPAHHSAPTHSKPAPAHSSHSAPSGHSHAKSGSSGGHKK